jgi:pimeloyl-ACP methyl ester carboxylesterase
MADIAIDCILCYKKTLFEIPGPQAVPAIMPAAPGQRWKGTMSLKHHRAPLAGLGLALLSTLAAAQTPAPGAAPRVAPPDCEARVGYDRDMVLHGYLIAKDGKPAQCVPFTSTAFKPPAGYAGDYYVDEFSDERLRERWAACKADAACIARVGKPIANRVPPNREYRITDERALFLLGRLKNTEAVVDLAAIRRPAFFAQAPYHEPIASAESHTYTVEFTAPAEPYERLQRNSSTDVKLRGWYLQGRGVDDGQGGKRRALVIMSAGGGGRLTAIDDPVDHLYHTDLKTGKTALNDFPNATTGSPGQRDWRLHMHLLHQAGFDVLSYDRRGVGLSGGYSDTNTLQQGRDILQVITNLADGKGMRVLLPGGGLREGPEAAKALMAGADAATLPVLLLGSSRGTMSTGWAMARNFDKACDYDLPQIRCAPPVGLRNIKGALLISEFTSGVGYVPADMTPVDEGRGLGRDRGLFIAGSQVEHNIVFFPSSAILASTTKWPAAFFARGLWDYADSLEGSIASYDRVPGPKELVVVRAPHPFETWPAQEKARVSGRLLAFAKALVLGQSSAPGGRAWSTMKELVATADDVWEPSSQPGAQPAQHAASQ